MLNQSQHLKVLINFLFLGTSVWIIIIFNFGIIKKHVSFNLIFNSLTAVLNWKMQNKTSSSLNLHVIIVFLKHDSPFSQVLVLLNSMASPSHFIHNLQWQQMHLLEVITWMALPSLFSHHQWQQLLLLLAIILMASPSHFSLQHQWQQLHLL